MKIIQFSSIKSLLHQTKQTPSESNDRHKRTVSQKLYWKLKTLEKEKVSNIKPRHGVGSTPKNNLSKFLLPVIRYIVRNTGTYIFRNWGDRRVSCANKCQSSVNFWSNCSNGLITAWYWYHRIYCLSAFQNTENKPLHLPSRRIFNFWWRYLSCRWSLKWLWNKASLIVNSAYN